MLDGDALISDGKGLPHVSEVLDVLTRFEPPARASLVVSLVADYEMPTTPVTPQKINRIFDKYVARLDELGLKQFFEPVGLRVTLSTHAGVFKPDARLFKKAIQRLRLRTGLDECLFVGNNAEQVKACRALGMSALFFDSGDWAEAPLLIARVVSPASNFNLRLALQLPLATTYDVQLIRIKEAQSRNIIHGLGKKLFPVPLKTETIEVPFTVQVDISLDKQGKIRDVKTDEPTAEAIAESADYVETLDANKQISHGEANVKGTATHELLVDEKGRKVLTRKRFI